MAARLRLAILASALTSAYLFTFQLAALASIQRGGIESFQTQLSEPGTILRC